MKVKSLIVAVVLLIALPIGISRASSAVNIGSYYSTETAAFGVSIQGMKKLSDGLFELSVVGAFGEGDNSVGFLPGLFVMEGGDLEVGLLQGFTSKWENTGGTNYIAGTSGVLVTYKLPWFRAFAQWQREWPFDGESALESTHKITLGVSMGIK